MLILEETMYASVKHYSKCVHAQTEKILIGLSKICS